MQIIMNLGLYGMRVLDIILVACITKASGCSKYNATSWLISDLKKGYAATIRPGLDDDTRVVVNVKYNLVSVSEVNEVRSYANFLGFIFVRWTDTRMQWDPQKYGGVTDVTLPSQMVWVPPIIVANPSEMVTYYKDVKTEVSFSYNGTAIWSPGSVSRTYCAMNIFVYPFDYHICSIIMVPEGVQAFSVNLTHALTDAVLDFYLVNSEWDMEETWTSDELAYGYMTFISFHFRLKRKPEFLVVNLLLPLMCISFLSIMVFLLPPESGERISFSVTVFLSYSVFITFVGQSIPRVSNPVPMLCYYILFLLVSSGLITVTAILNLKLHHKGVILKPLKCIVGLTSCLRKPKAKPYCSKSEMEAFSCEQNIGENIDFDFTHEDKCEKHETMISNCGSADTNNFARLVDGVAFCFFTIINIAVLAGVIWKTQQE